MRLFITKFQPFIENKYLYFICMSFIILKSLYIIHTLYIYIYKHLKKENFHENDLN